MNSNKKTLTPSLLICECSSTEHQIVIHYNEDDNIAYCHVHLTTHKNFFKRLWAALRYTFGYKSKYGAWDEFILTPAHAKQLEGLLRLFEGHRKGTSKNVS